MLFRSPPATILERGTEGIKDFLASIHYAKRTHRLDLSKMGLSSIPPEVFPLTGLKRLALDANDLDHLPPEIGLLTSLEELTFSDNHVAELPPEIGNLASLTELDFKGNQMTTVPIAVGRLSNLTMLSSTRKTSRLRRKRLWRQVPP